MRNFIFTRFDASTETQVICPVEEAKWMVIDGEGKTIELRPETNTDWNRNRSMLKAFGDLYYHKRYTLPEPGLVLFAGVDPDDDFAGNCGYVHATYSGKRAVAPELREFPLGWAGLYRFAGVMKTVDLLDKRSKEEKALEDQVWGSYLPTPEYVSLKGDMLQALRTGRPIRLSVAAKHVNRFAKALAAQWAMPIEQGTEDRTNRIISASNWAGEIRPAMQQAREEVAQEEANGGYELPDRLMIAISNGGEIKQMNLMKVKASRVMIRYASGGIYDFNAKWDPANKDLVKLYEGYATEKKIVALN